MHDTRLMNDEQVLFAGFTREVTWLKVNHGTLDGSRMLCILHSAVDLTRHQ